MISGTDQRPGRDGEPSRNSGHFGSGAQRERPLANCQLSGLLSGYAVSEALRETRVGAVRPDLEVGVRVSGWGAGVGDDVETGSGIEARSGCGGVKPEDSLPLAGIKASM